MAEYKIIGCDSEVIQKAVELKHSMDIFKELRSQYISELNCLRDKYQKEFENQLTSIRSALDL